MIRMTLVAAMVAAGMAGCTSTNQWSASSEGSEKNSPMNEQPGRTGLTSIDQGFARDAIQNATFEVMMSKLALKQSSNPEVTKLAGRIIDEQGRIAADLKKIADERGEQFAMGPTYEQEETIKRLGTLNGEDFDKEYLRQLKQTNKESLAGFQSESQWGKNEDVRSVSNRSLPILQDQQKLITGEMGPASASERE